MKGKMISLEVVGSDKFACMTIPARYLYYELLVRADENGCVRNPVMTARMVGCDTEELQELYLNGYVVMLDALLIKVTDGKVWVRGE